jgi:3-hydroxyacyl-[acyl-carrier-protein] dehydratase
VNGPTDAADRRTSNARSAARSQHDQARFGSPVVHPGISPLAIPGIAPLARRAPPGRPGRGLPATFPTMHFRLVDRFLELTDTSAVGVKNVTAAEEYLQDHFPGFPVLPGVFMVEALTQAARAVMEKRGTPRMVLGEVKALRYGSFVRPGETLKVEVTLEKTKDDGTAVFKAQGTVLRGASDPSAPSETAVAGRLILRPLRNEAFRDLA